VRSAAAAPRQTLTRACESRGCRARADARARARRAQGLFSDVFDSLTFEQARRAPHRALSLPALSPAAPTVSKRSLAAQSPPLASRLCAPIDDADVAGSFASGLESGFSWSASADASFFSDDARGVAVALLTAAALPPQPSGRAGAPPVPPQRAPRPEAAELARLYFALTATSADATSSPQRVALDAMTEDATEAEDMNSGISAVSADVASPPSSIEDDAWRAKAAELTSLSGGFAFIIHDAARNTVLAARDAAGAAPLFWAAAPDGALLFASSLRSGVAAGTPSATEFPKGCLFLSSGGVHPAESPGPRGFTMAGGRACASPGALRSFARPAAAVRAIPRISSRGVLCGAVFRVASGADLAGDGGARAA
jgi:hypothetical protein